jgi:hypothetical protein
MRGVRDSTIVLTLGGGGMLSAEGDLTVSLGRAIEENGAVVGGVFCRWRFENGRFHIENDRHGFFPAFYAQSGNRLVISTGIGSILRADMGKGLDSDALAVALRLGWHIGDETPFRDIRRLPPGVCFSLTAQGIGLAATAPEPAQPYDGGHDEAIDRYIALFRESMRRILQDAGPWQLPLSGGRDSRHILLEALWQQLPPQRALTARFLPPRSENDAEIAGLLLDGTDVSHRLVAADERLFPAVCDHLRLCNGMTAEHVWSLGLRRALLERKNAPFLDGLAGDALSQSLFQSRESLALVEDGRYEDLADSVLRSWQSSRGFSDEAIRVFFTPDLGQSLSRDAAIASLAAEIARSAGQINPVQAFYFANRTRNGPGFLSFGVLRDVRAYFPYLDYELVDFLQSLPPHLVARKDFHTQTIDRAYPRFQTIPYATPQGRISLSGRSIRSYYLLLAKHMAQTSSHILRRAPILKSILSSALRRELPNEAWSRPFLLQLLLHLEALLEA